MRRLWFAMLLALAIAGCGSDEASLPDYVDEVNAVLEQGQAQYTALIQSGAGEVLIAPSSELNNFTPHDLHLAMEQVAEIQRSALDEADAIDPPQQVAELHRLFFRRLPIEALAARAGTATTWEELSESREMADYRSALAEDKKVCAEFQSILDAATDGESFAISSWLTVEIEDIAEAAIGCSSLPADPDNLYRPPAP